MAIMDPSEPSRSWMDHIDTSYHSPAARLLSFPSIPPLPPPPVYNDPAVAADLEMPPPPTPDHPPPAYNDPAVAASLEMPPPVYTPIPRYNEMTVEVAWDVPMVPYHEMSFTILFPGDRVVSEEFWTSYGKVCAEWEEEMRHTIYRANGLADQALGYIRENGLLRWYVGELEKRLVREILRPGIGM
ncbi:hypothetical protein EJ02DRAFT_515509 [Clathrospora elynae]|uniref:Uncharacterized protein n=1 Tax=Clathrospora elynae TaxID=706981 RepID=A0A6A5SB96_9PLEO|nr:hypothetical protein EJ02DRAFT_515509 [Clathrospora elynae]